MAAKIVSFINLKGDVGKSTLALAIGETLAFIGQNKPGWINKWRGSTLEFVKGYRRKRQRVLLVDIDLQSNLSYATTSRQRIQQLEQSKHTVYDMFASALRGTPWDIQAAINKSCSNIAGNTHLHNLVCSPALGQLE